MKISKFYLMMPVYCAFVACGSSPRSIQVDDVSGLASVSVVAPSELKAGKDFDKVVVSYLQGTSGANWSGKREFKADNLTDATLTLKTGLYVFAVELWKDAKKVAASREGDPNCDYVRETLKAGANALVANLCVYDLDQRPSAPPTGKSSEADVSINTTLKNRDGSIFKGPLASASPISLKLDDGSTASAKFLTDKQLDVWLKAKPSESKTTQSCSIKARAISKKLSDASTVTREASSDVKFDVSSSSGREVSIRFASNEFEGLDTPSQVSILYRCNIEGDWLVLAGPIKPDVE